MRTDDWIVDFLIDKGVTDVFGIPGVVVMDFLYAVDRKKPVITPHLNYHEQGAAYAACGYAQVEGKLGVAYSTRGPGLTNMITAIADAYYDSIPVMFITAHSSKELEPRMRVLNNQEIDTVALVENVTKRAVRIDDIKDFKSEIITSYQTAMSGRKGPVFLDIWNGLFSLEVDDSIDVDLENQTFLEDTEETLDSLKTTIETKLKQSKRPIVLIGNGVRGKEGRDLLNEIVNQLEIPVLSSRGAQDIIPESPYYYGYVGSRATRYSNFILSKADLIISLGNRLSFPTKSKSFRPIIEKADIIRIDIDDTEFLRQLDNCSSFKLDCLSALKMMKNAELKYENSKEWICTCNYLKTSLDKYDCNNVISIVMNIINQSDRDSALVCDVGNHSFWITMAHAYLDAKNRIMYSASFGTLGSALPKAIGAYYATRKPVICFTGDQGIQFNIQELEYISKHKIPITVVVLNNSSSGMIMEREIAKYGNNLVHTTTDSGYGFPSFEKIASCYGMKHTKIKEESVVEVGGSNVPQIIEVMINPNEELKPSLPIGKPCQDLWPELPRALYNELNCL